jgi:hypothetical protein
MPVLRAADGGQKLEEEATAALLDHLSSVVGRLFSAFAFIFY